MTILNKASFNIDFTSDYRLTGWALEVGSQEFPKHIQLRAKNGMSFDITDVNLVVRTDVCEKFDLPTDTALGFEINLLDVFNDRLHGYSIFIGEEEIWSQEKYFSLMDNEEVLTPISLPQHFGEKQVIVIYKKNEWLYSLLQKIHTTNPTFFDKNYQSGVSFLFITASEFGKKKDILLKSSTNTIFILEQTEYRQIFGISPTLLSKWPVLLLNKKINQTNDFNGLLSVISSLSDINTDVNIKASSLAIMLTSISAYNSLLFDDQTHFFSYQSGTPKKWMENIIRGEIKNKTKEDIIILSNQRIKTLKDVSPFDSAIFIRTSALRFIIDSVGKDTLTFLKTVYKRGLHVKVIYEGDLI